MSDFIPKANVNDLISASNNSHPSPDNKAGSTPISEFISMLSRYAQPVQEKASNFLNNTPVGRAVQAGLPATQFITQTPGAKFVENIPRGVGQAVKGFGELVGSAAQTSANKILEPITHNPGTIQAIPESTMKQYEWDKGPIGRLRPLIQGGLQTANAEMAALTPGMAGANPVNFLKSTLATNAGLQGSGELLKGIREQTPFKEVAKNVFKATFGDSKVAGPLSGLFGNTPLAVAGDTALGLAGPLIVGFASDKQAHEFSQLRDEQGRFSVSGIKKVLGDKINEKMFMEPDGTVLTLPEYMQKHGYTEKGGFINFGAEVGGEATPTLLDKNGQPMVKPPETPIETGSYTRDANGKLTPNPNPEPSILSPEPAVMDQSASLRTPGSAPSVSPKGTSPLAPPNPVENNPLPQGPGRTVTRIKVPASVYGAGSESQIQSTVDQYVPGNTAVEQYKNLQPTLDAFGKEIQATIANNPKMTTVQDAMKVYDQNLDKAGIYRTTTNTRGSVQQAANKYMRSITGIGDESGEISSVDLADALHKVNKDAGPVFKKIDNGSKLLPQDEVILAARQTIRDSLTGMYGGEGGPIDSLLRKQSDLYDAADSLYKQRDTEFKIQDTNGGKQGVLSKVLTNPLVDLVGGGAIVGGAVAGAQGLAGINSSNQQDSKGESIDPSEFSPSDPTKTGDLLDTNTASSQLGQYQKQASDNQLNNPNAANAAQGNYLNLKQKVDAQAPVLNAWQGYKTTTQLAKNAYSEVNSADPSFINALSKGYDNAMTANGGKYSALVVALQALGKSAPNGGIDFSKAKSKNAIIGAIKAAMDASKATYNSTFSSYNSNYSPDSQNISKNPNPTGLPPIPSVPQSHLNWQTNLPY